MATKATARNVDFTNVKEGSVYNNKRIEAGDYLAKITQVVDSEVKSGNNKGTPQFEFAIKVMDHPSSVLPYRCALTENQLWKLRNILIAAGKSVPKRRTKVDPNAIVGKLIGISVEDDEYEKDGETRPTSQITGVFPAADLGDQVVSKDEDEDEDEDEDYSEPDTDSDDEEDDEPEAEEEDDEEEEENDPLADMNRTQLKAAIIKIQSDFQARKSQSDDDLREVLRGLQSASADEEEEAPAPKKAPKPAAGKAKRKAKPKAEDVDDEELDELDIDSL